MHENYQKYFLLVFIVLNLAVSSCGTKSVHITAEERSSKYPIHGAIRQDNVARLSNLLDGGGDINGKDEEGWTPLMVAVYWENPDLVRRLLDRGANVQARTNDGNTALNLAMKAGGSIAGPSKTKELIDIVDLLISRGADLEKIGSSGYTPLHQAASLYRVELAELLLKRGAKVNSRPDGPRFPGVTPLHIAVDLRGLGPSYTVRAERMVRLLLDYGADVHIRTRFSGETPLLSALNNSPANANIVRMLIDQGANVNDRCFPSSDKVYYREMAGDTPLHRAAFHHEVEIAEILLARGADVNAKNAKGITPLALAHAWEEQSRGWGRPDINIGYREVINVLKRYGGGE